MRMTSTPVNGILKQNSNSGALDWINKSIRRITMIQVHIANCKIMAKIKYI